MLVIGVLFIAHFVTVVPLNSQALEAWGLCLQRCQAMLLKAWLSKQ